MHCAYVGIVTHRGLELYYPEGEHTARFLIARLRRYPCSRAYCVWFVIDMEFDEVLAALLHAGHPDGAWALVQDAAREYGPVLSEGDLPVQFDQSA